MSDVKIELPSQTMGKLQSRVMALESVLRERERELLEIKGPCSNSDCGLHYAHRGPCDGKGEGK
jgi:3-deoxy-D-arabino-heptulosonate 7-phosphate (DAHP) synthase